MGSDAKLILVGGWAMAATQNASLVIHALHIALVRRRPPGGLLHPATSIK